MEDRKLTPREWRKAVLDRDIICQYSGAEPGFWPHTILDHKDYPGNTYKLWNGIALSEAAHKAFHDKYGYRGFTVDDLEKFLDKKLPEPQRSEILKHI